MALTLQSVDVDELQKQRRGFISISLTEWTTTSEDLLCEGSVFECAGAVYYAAGDEDIDSTASLAGLGAGTIVYVYFDPGTLQLYCSGTAPAWDDAKQGYYLGASPTHRCLFQFYKVGAGDYTNKIIYYNRDFGITYTGTAVGIGANGNRTMQFATDAEIVWNETEDQFEPNKGINLYDDLAGGAEVQLATHNGAGSSAEFIITKPVTCYITTTAAGADVGYLRLKYSGGYVTTDITVYATANPRAHLIGPGTYVITNSGAGYTTTLYAIAVYGAPAVTAADILG